MKSEIEKAAESFEKAVLIMTKNKKSKEVNFFTKQKRMKDKSDLILEARRLGCKVEDLM